MIIRKADRDSEAGVMASEQLLADMMKYNEPLARPASCWPAKGWIPVRKARA